MANTNDYPWTEEPLIAAAPMRLIALSELACAVSNALGLGFIGAGNDVSNLEEELEKSKKLLRVQSGSNVLPIGVGFLVWAGDGLLQKALQIVAKYRPAAVWLFAPKEKHQLSQWTEEMRRVTDNQTKIWIQIGTVADACEVTKSCSPDVLVVQGTDAGGHGLNQGASIITLLPEVDDAIGPVCVSDGKPKPQLIGAGGIMDGRGVAAALALGATGVCLGTAYLATPEANIAKGYQDAVLCAADGGVTTARGKLYDALRGTTDWPDRYGGRGVLNESWFDNGKGMSFEENKLLYDEALKKGDSGWGSQARLTTYAGTGVGLVKSVRSAEVITEEVRRVALGVLEGMYKTKPRAEQ
ncbi:hypothetical protein AMS68_006809 [Peltaster fructicola]|uniref:Uncharacterized protein n=1 Tax=Peltaster fructicola TaxID=286661 RepID=A0A6H0Y2P5_9PEZI|nr:hypothetical protein AMS68_006809 [Peltaster fructicola]